MTYENEVLPTGVTLKTGGPKKRNMCMYMESLMCGSLNSGGFNGRRTEHQIGRGGP